MRGAALALRLRIDPLRERPSAWFAALATLLGLTALAAALAGAVELPAEELPRALWSADHPLHAALVQVRLPRILGAVAVGAALGVAGALMQAVVRNPLADPGLIGVTQGAGVAALLAIIFLPQSTLLLPVFAFGGAALALSVLMAATWTGARTVGPLRIILTGVALQAIFFGVISLLLFFYADRAPAFVSFVVGSLNGLGWRDLGIVTATTLPGVALALLAARPLNLLLLDDATASGVGLAVRRARLAAAALAALLAAGSVSVAGLVAFVGLVVPNWVRVAVGPDHHLVLPLAALGGGTLALAADTVGRSLVAPLELPVGALLALVGGPYFLLLLWRKLS